MNIDKTIKKVGLCLLIVIIGYMFYWWSLFLLGYLFGSSDAVGMGYFSIIGLIDFIFGLTMIILVEILLFLGIKKCIKSIKALSAPEAK